MQRTSAHTHTLAELAGPGHVAALTNVDKVGELADLQRLQAGQQHMPLVDIPVMAEVDWIEKEKETQKAGGEYPHQGLPTDAGEPRDSGNGAERKTRGYAHDAQRP